MTKNPIIDARELVTELYPHARWALLADSVLMGARVAGSDLGIVVMLPDGDPRAPRHESRRYRGWPVELFVHDERSLAHHLTKEFAARKPELHRMVGTGFALVGHPHVWRERCASVLAGRRPPAGRDSVHTGPAGHGCRPRTIGRRRPHSTLGRSGFPRPRHGALSRIGASRPRFGTLRLPRLPTPAPCALSRPGFPRPQRAPSQPGASRPRIGSPSRPVTPATCA